MKPRILHIVADLQQFGLGEQAAWLAAAQSGEWAGEIFCCGAASASAWESCTSRIPLHVYPTRGRNWLGAGARLRAILAKRRFALVHSWGAAATCLTGWTLGTLRAADRPARWIAQCDASAQRGVGRPIFGSVRPRAVLAIGAADGGKRRPAATVPLIVPPISSSAGDLRRLLRLPPQTKLIGTVCPLHARSGLKHLIFSLDQLKCLYNNLHLVVWGSGPHAHHFRRYARQVGVGDWLSWRSPAGNVRSEMAGLDFYWHAPRETVVPLSLVEALARGLPAIAAGSPSTDWLHDIWGTGLRLVPWGAREEISRQMHEWLRQGAGTADDRSAASHWLSEHTAEVAATAYANAYRNGDPPSASAPAPWTAADDRGDSPARQVDALSADVERRGAM